MVNSLVKILNVYALNHSQSVENTPLPAKIPALSHCKICSIHAMGCQLHYVAFCERMCNVAKWFEKLIH